VITHPFISITLTHNDVSVFNGAGTSKTYGGELMVAIYTQLLTEPSQIYTSYGEVPVKEFIVTCIAMVYKYLISYGCCGYLLTHFV